MAKQQNHQLNQLAEHELAVQAEEAREAGAVWYYSKTMCQIHLPTARYIGTELVRHSGSFHLVVQSAPPLDVPWGIYPRGILSWLCTEIVHNKAKGSAARTLKLGSSLAEFMQTVSGSTYSGGVSGNIRRFKRQLSALFSSRILFWVGKEELDVTTGAGAMMQIGEGWNLMWHNQIVDQPGLVPSTVQVTEPFFKDCLSSPPVDKRIIHALWPNCLAFDMYVWLTYKAFVMEKRRQRNFELSWEALKQQFGPNYKQMKTFRHQFLEELAKVRRLYTKMEFSEQEGKGMRFQFKGPSISSRPVSFHIIPRIPTNP